MFYITPISNESSLNTVQAMPKWNWWTGHLLVLKDNLDRLPADANVYYAMQDLVLKQHTDTEIFLMDYWPIHEPVYMISAPDVSMQVANKYNLQKPFGSAKKFSPIVGGESLISMNDDEWKLWRSLFNPGFSASHMLELVPAIVDSVEVFCSLLQEKAEKRQLFSLSEMTMRLTMDIITKVTLDKDLNHQRQEHSYAHALNMITKWHSFWDPRIILNPMRPFVQRHYGGIVLSFVYSELEKRFHEMKRARHESGPSNMKSRAKSVVALALDAYISEQEQTKSLDTIVLEKGFARLVSNQIRLFVFAGNDSTSSTIDYTYHLLSKPEHAGALSRLCEEHESIFGSMPTTPQKIKDEPALLNKCAFTFAVLKEVLRLYPPSSSLREGQVGISLVDAQGGLYPTEGIGATIMHHFVHRHPRHWPRSGEFLPERWLALPGDPLYVNEKSGIFRPFETGPRNCIAQTLVYNELKIVLILTARKFDVREAYDEWDQNRREQEGLVRKLLKAVGLRGEPIKTVMGERAYQTSSTGSHPSDGYPCRVSLRQGYDLST